MGINRKSNKPRISILNSDLSPLDINTLSPDNSPRSQYIHIKGDSPFYKSQHSEIQSALLNPDVI